MNLEMSLFALLTFSLHSAVDSSWIENICVEGRKNGIGVACDDRGALEEAMFEATTIKSNGNKQREPNKEDD